MRRAELEDKTAERKPIVNWMDVDDALEFWASCLRRIFIVRSIRTDQGSNSTNLGCPCVLAPDDDGWQGGPRL